MNRTSFKKNKHLSIILYVIVLVLLKSDVATSANPSVTFEQSVKGIDCYKYVEVSVKLEGLPSINPFIHVKLRGKFGLKGEPTVEVDGFCDSEDGSLYRIRFMPTKPGDYEYKVNIYGSGLDMKKTGTFTARKGKSKGIVRVDKKHPWHFIWDGTDEHFFWNSSRIWCHTN